MAYKQTTSGRVGWPSGQPAVPDVWSQQQQSPLLAAPSGFQQQQFNAAMTQEALDFCRNYQLQEGGGVMGPPPVPQKPVANGHIMPPYPLIGSQLSSQHSIGSRVGFQGIPVDGIAPSATQNEQALGSVRPQVPPNFITKDSFQQFQQAQAATKAKLNLLNLPQSLSGVHSSSTQGNHSRPNDNHRDVGLNKGNGQPAADVNSYLSSSATGPDARLNAHASKRNADLSFKPELSEPGFNQQPTMPSPAKTTASLVRSPPDEDLHNVLANFLSSNNNISNDSVSISSNDGKPHSAPHQSSANNSKPSETFPASALPSLNRLLPPLPASRNMHQADQQESLVDDGSDKDKPKRKRRKRCGMCEPCKVKEDCGECYVCRNKGQVNAICKKRKCFLLRKKVRYLFIFDVSKIECVLCVKTYYFHLCS